MEVRSAGSEPADQINPDAVEAMREVGIDIASAQPKLLTYNAIDESDVVITMDCGDTCPIFAGTRYEVWDLEDPAGKDITVVRRIRDDIRERVEVLISGLTPARNES